jgi:hypothetical protein
VPDLTPYNAGQIRRIQGQDGRYIGLSWAATGRRLACVGWPKHATRRRRSRHHGMDFRLFRPAEVAAGIRNDYGPVGAYPALMPLIV